MQHTPVSYARMMIRAQRSHDGRRQAHPPIQSPQWKPEAQEVRPATIGGPDLRIPEASM
jgi:hypothetical protein